MDWQTLENMCRSCQKCSLFETRTNLVFGTGAKDAKIMIIGEGPGESEDLQGEPFVGRAGQLLDRMLELIGLDRNKNVYIANIVKCRPPKNRDPLALEQEACIGWLRKQFALIRPKIVICLGRIAAKAIMQEDFKITQDHGRLFEKRGVYFMALYHPAALLRDDSKKPDTFVDLKKLRRHIEEICPEVLENTNV